MMGIVLVVAFVVAVVVYVKIRYVNITYIANQFKANNTIVFGKKGSGKDILFSAVIKKRKRPHYSNIEYYKEKTEVKPLNYLSVEPNVYNDFIDGKVTVIKKNISEKVDYYLSDGGIYLPSQYDNLLSKMYPSLPIFYALSRHLGNMNIHVNVQNLNRLWIKLREQADCYVRTKRAVNLGFWMLVTTYVYENYNDALELLKPIKKTIKGDVSKVEESSRGMIEKRSVLVPKRWLEYDSRYFHKVIYGKEAPRRKRLRGVNEAPLLQTERARKGRRGDSA